MTDAETINEVMKDCWQTSEDHGWHESEGLVEEVRVMFEDLSGISDQLKSKILDALHIAEGGVDVMQKLMLMVTELAEAAEDYRGAGIPLTRLYWKDDEGEFHDYQFEDAAQGRKAIGFPSEMADVVIRVMDLCNSLGIDLGFAIQCKAAYNKTRPYKHGNKRA